MQRGFLRRLLLSLLVVVPAGCDAPSPPGPDAALLVDGESSCDDADCDDGLFCNGAERCLAAGACGAGPSPCSGPCDEATDTCGSCATPDADGDGVASLACGGTDCDDTDPNRAPGRAEVCDVDDRDEDCDPSTFGVRDLDGDSWPDANCCNGTTCGSDCEDTRNTVHPGQADLCNMLDDDCDGLIDEAVTTRAWHPDCDGDGHARADGTEVLSCEPPPGPASECGGVGGWSLTLDDCDDTSASRFPGAIEVCDGIDNDCNDLLDGPGEDDDGDGHADACAGAGATDCDDACATCFPGAAPLTGMCDGLDHDCDGSIDEGILRTWYGDGDGDGVGVASTTRAACAMPPGHAASAGDCNDADGYTGTCAAPLSCVRGIACGCEVTLAHGRDYFDLDTGAVIRLGYWSGGSDLYVEWGSEVGSPPVPWYVRMRTGRMHQHLPFTPLSRVDATYATSMTLAPIDTYFTPDRVILVQATGLYKLGRPERVVASDGFTSIRFIYAPIGTPPAGFACAAPY